MDVVLGRFHATRALSAGLAGALLAVASVADAASSGCAESWSGEWMVTAEGRPVMIFDFEPGANRQLGGAVETWSAASISLNAISPGGSAQTSPLLIERCDSTSVEVRTNPGGSGSSALILRRLDSESAWMEISSLPPNLESPKYALRKATTGEADLAPLPFPGELFFDTLGSSSGDSNQELAQLFFDDQEERRVLLAAATGNVLEDPRYNDLIDQDRVRLARVREMVETDLVKTGPDFFRAAFILQHGEEPSHFLLAHHMALMAMSFGMTDARWISAATLDRYLLSIGQPQVYGTQFSTEDGVRSTLEPYAEDLIPRRDKAAMSVAPDEQEGD